MDSRGEPMAEHKTQADAAERMRLIGKTSPKRAISGETCHLDHRRKSSLESPEKLNALAFRPRVGLSEASLKSIENGEHDDPYSIPLRQS